MDPFLALLLIKRYIADFQVHLPNPARIDKKIRCLEQLSAKADLAPFLVKHDHFGVLAGDTVQVVQCTRLKVKLRAAEACYKDIPIQHKRWKYLDMENRVAKECPAASTSPPESRACFTGGRSTATSEMPTR